MEGRKINPAGEIFAIDEVDGTVYVLFREGEPPVMADWPQYLWELAPAAVRMGTIGMEVWNTGLNGHLRSGLEVDEVTEAQLRLDDWRDQLSRT